MHQSTSKLLLFNKPYGVLSQFSDHDGHQGLANFIRQPGIYPAGRLDQDSEGLLLLTDDGQLQARISHPKHKMAKTYLVQVEGEITKEALSNLAAGINLKDGPTRRAQVKQVPTPPLWQRDPPIRQRKNQPTSWLELKISEGRNRQVRRMTAAVGFPTLRLVRIAIGPWSLGSLQPGEWRLESVNLPATKTMQRKPFKKYRRD
ncbi:MAG: pseudouridine synthase [Gammaproteobacteria bacterium]|nr:MAG: pseudouridine synthase [Gammaproteobacteria bacterium]